MRILKILTLAVAIGCTRATTVPSTPTRSANGHMPATWYAGSATCDNTPAFHVHEYSSGFYILRQPACTNFEKPFLFLIIGRSRAFLLDTGAGNINVAAVVDSVLNAWRSTHNGAPTALVVAHSHGHGDHVAGDDQFRGRTGVTLVERDTLSVRQYFAFTSWPEQRVTIDLGERVIDVIAIPGHQPASLAYYDRTSHVLLPGDSFYPGRLYVRDTAAFVRSITRLVTFTASHSIAAILGTHIEQTNHPFVDYPEGTKDQPAEHTLELTRTDLVVLDSALNTMRGRVVRTRLPAFSIWPLP